MWPRRPRMMRRLMRRAFIAEVVDPQLAEAHQLFSTGQYAQAAEQFEALANQALARDGLRAPHFLLQAGLGWAYAGQGARGMPLIMKGLSLLSARRARFRTRRAAERVMAGLQAAGYAEGAQQVAAWLAGQPVPTATPVQPPAHRNLPTHCPGCGGPVNPGEVDWLDDATAECVYCGSPIRAEIT